eukprot:7663167-Pyramimonas_sp.AAC.1
MMMSESGSHPLFTARRRTVGTKWMRDRPVPSFFVLCSGLQDKPCHIMPSRAPHRVPCMATSGYGVGLPA